MRVILARMDVRKKNRNEFVKIMSESANRAQKEYSCQKFEIYQHLNDDCTFSFFGIWDSPNGFKEYLKSDEFSMVLLAFKLLRKSPEIRYFKNHMGTGMHELMELRKLISN